MITQNKKGGIHDFPQHIGAITGRQRVGDRLADELLRIHAGRARFSQPKPLNVDGLSRGKIGMLSDPSCSLTASTSSRSLFRLDEPGRGIFHDHTCGPSFLMSAGRSLPPEADSPRTVTIVQRTRRRPSGHPTVPETRGSSGPWGLDNISWDRIPGLATAVTSLPAVPASEGRLRRPHFSTLGDLVKMGVFRRLKACSHRVPHRQGLPSRRHAGSNISCNVPEVIRHEGGGPHHRAGGFHRLRLT